MLKGMVVRLRSENPPLASASGGIYHFNGGKIIPEGIFALFVREPKTITSGKAR